MLLFTHEDDLALGCPAGDNHFIHIYSLLQPYTCIICCIPFYFMGALSVISFLRIPDDGAGKVVNIDVQLTVKWQVDRKCCFFGKWIWIAANKPCI